MDVAYSTQLWVPRGAGEHTQHFKYTAKQYNSYCCSHTHILDGLRNSLYHGPRNDFIVGVAMGQLLPKIYKYAYIKMAPKVFTGGQWGSRRDQAPLAPHFLSLWSIQQNGSL